VRIVRSGNLDYKVNTYSGDELGKISREFDKVVEELKKVKEDLMLSQQKVDAQQEEIGILKKKEEHFRRLFGQSNDAVFVYDLEGQIIDVNAKACEMLGFPREVLMKTAFSDLQEESELTISKYAFKTGTETCDITYETRMKRANGQTIDVQVSTVSVDLKAGIMQSIVSNISAKKEMQKAIEESEERFRTFMETANDFMFIINGEGRISYANSAMYNALGYLKEEIEGMGVTDIISQDSLDDQAEAEMVLKEKEEVRYELVLETKHRKKIYGEMVASGIFNPAGELTGVRGVFRDLTEKKKIMEAQRLANLGKLAADVSHEVNNPITIIMGRAEMLLISRKDDKDLCEKMKIIVEQCESAISIVKRLLKFSKPSKKEFTRVNMNDMVQNIINLVKHQFQTCGVSIKAHFSEDIPAIEADEKQIQEVFMNLMRNANEAMPEGGSIDIYTYSKSGKVFVDFKDNGEGISAEAKEKIFDPFFTTKEKGTGLGLSVCYGIIKAHDGDLQLFSEKKEGTTARVSLPCK
jgi:PAS domain S-box-containing protein